LDSPCQRCNRQIEDLQGVDIFILHGSGEVWAIPYLCVVDNIHLELDFIDLGEACCMAKSRGSHNCGRHALDVIEVEGGYSNTGGAR
jgi:hypothetical protein